MSGFNENILVQRSQQYFLAASHDPSVIATEGAKGTIYLRIGVNGGMIYQKQDDGASTNWSVNGTFSGSTVQQSGVTQTTNTMVLNFIGATVTPGAPGVADITIAAAGLTGAANVGAGAGIFRDVTGGVTANFKSLVAGANITLTPAADEITIAATAATPTGTVNTAGFFNSAGDLDSNANFQFLETENSLSLGSGHTVPALSLNSFLIGTTHTLVAGVANCAFVGTTLNLTGAGTVARSMIVGTAITKTAGSLTDSILSGTTYSNSANILQSIIGGSGHPLSGPISGCLIVGSTNTVTGANSANNNIIGGSGITLTDGPDNNLVVATTASLASGCTSNHVAGSSITVNATCANNIIGGISNALGTSSSNNIVGGQSITTGSSNSRNIYSGTTYTTPSLCVNNIIGGNNHNFSVGTMTSSLIVGSQSALAQNGTIQSSILAGSPCGINANISSSIMAGNSINDAVLTRSLVVGLNNDIGFRVGPVGGTVLDSIISGQFSCRSVNTERSIITGADNNITTTVRNSFIGGQNNAASEVENSIIIGDGAALGGAGLIYRSFLGGTNNTVNSCDSTLIIGSAQLVENTSSSIVAGDTNTVSGFSNVAIFGSGSTATRNNQVLIGEGGAPADADTMFSVGAGANIHLRASDDGLVERTSGGLRVRTRDDAAAAVTIDARTDYMVRCSNGGAVTVNLPAGVNGMEYKIKAQGATTLTLTPNGADTIDVGAVGAGVGVTIVFHGTEWSTF